jgi:hypothetical protein
MAYLGHVRNGVVVLAGEAVLPEGAAVAVELLAVSPDGGPGLEQPHGRNGPALSKPEPNRLMLQAMQQVEVLQQGMNPKPGKDSQDYLREARSGALYGHATDE